MQKLVGKHQSPFRRSSRRWLGPIFPARLRQVVWLLGLLVFPDEVHDNLPGLVELSQAVGEGSLSLVLFEKGVPLPQSVVLEDYPLEQSGDAGVVRQHETGYPMR